MAPETKEGEMKWERTGDIHALGVVLFEMGSGRLKKNRVSDEDLKTTKFPKEMKTLLDACLSPTPEKRPSTLTLLKHPVL